MNLCFYLVFLIINWIWLIIPKSFLKSDSFIEFSDNFPFLQIGAFQSKNREFRFILKKKFKINGFSDFGRRFPFWKRFLEAEIWRWMYET